MKLYGILKPYPNGPIKSIYYDTTTEKLDGLHYTLSFDERVILKENESSNDYKDTVLLKLMHRVPEPIAALLYAHMYVVISRLGYYVYSGDFEQISRGHHLNRNDELLEEYKVPIHELEVVEVLLTKCRLPGYYPQLPIVIYQDRKNKRQLGSDLRWEKVDVLRTKIDRLKYEYLKVVNERKVTNG